MIPRQRGQGLHAESRIVVGVSGSASSLAALRWSVRIALRVNCSVDAVTAVSPLLQYPTVAVMGAGLLGSAVPEARPGSLSAAPEEVSRRTTAVLDALPWVPVRRLHLAGDPVTVLAGIGRPSDVLVVGAHTKAWWKDLLEPSIYRRLLRRSQCPVLVAGQSIRIL